MATCGYVCPLCEGKGLDDNGELCRWCTPVLVNNSKKIEVEDEDKKKSIQDWINDVHEGPCCGDL